MVISLIPINYSKLKKKFHLSHFNFFIKFENNSIFQLILELFLFLNKKEKIDKIIKK